MNFGSLFTGVGGFDLGFERAGMKCAWQVEVDPHCVEVLERHYSEVKRYDDVRTVGKQNLEPVELICGGFPCQDLSIAGKRAGFDGERSSLWFEFERIIDEMQPKWVVIENVPGLLSSRNGDDFGVILKSLDGFGYGVAWRILDSQYFGVAQRRRRVFIVGSLGNPCAGEVLFEREGLSGDFAAGREKGKRVAETFTVRSGKAGGGKGYLGSEECAMTLGGQPQYLANTLAGGSSKCHSDITSGQQGGNVVYTLLGNQIGREVENGPQRSEGWLKDQSFTLNTVDKHAVSIWEMSHADDVVRDSGHLAPTLQKRMGTDGNQIPLVGVRRLTPTECCRLQGFPDDWNDNVSDTQRYKQMGNAVTVNLIEWIGERIMSNKQLTIGGTA